jgi:hypothetical protein
VEERVVEQDAPVDESRILVLPQPQSFVFFS